MKESGRQIVLHDVRSFRKNFDYLLLELENNILQVAPSLPGLLPVPNSEFLDVTVLYTCAMKEAL